MRKLVAPLMILTVALAACSDNGEKDKGAEEHVAASCAPAPASDGSVVTKLPNNFPTPDLVTYTGSSKAGPSTIVEGYFGDDLDGAYAEYKKELHDAGFSVTHSELDPADAEVDFSGGGSTGEVKMTWPCKGRTDLEITVRPA